MKQHTIDDLVSINEWIYPEEDEVPVKMEKQLKKQAKKKGLKGKRAGAYVYGTMRKTGWKPEREGK